MRILYLGINYWPDESGIAPFATGRCEYLAECGHEVVACTGPPYYPQWRVPAPYRRRLLVREERAGVSIRRSWMYVPRKPTSLRRMVHEGTFVCSSFMRALCSPRPDLLLVVSPPLGLAASAIALGRLWRVPYVLHVTDLQPDAEKSGIEPWRMAARSQRELRPRDGSALRGNATQQRNDRDRQEKAAEDQRGGGE